MLPDHLFWNDVYEEVRRTGLYSYDTDEKHWLTTYLPMLRGFNVSRVLEIGCGSGLDTKMLEQEGFHVTASDFSPSALQLVRDQLPDVALLLHDVRDPFPFGDGTFDLVLASLSLHYFDEATTAKIVDEIKRLLRPRGLLLYRMNSTADPKYGEGQGDLLEKDIFLQQGIRRRFFSIASCRQSFAGWEEILLEEKTVDCYGKPKTLIEGLVRRVNE